MSRRLSAPSGVTKSLSPHVSKEYKHHAFTYLKKGSGNINQEYRRECLNYVTFFWELFNVYFSLGKCECELFYHSASVSLNYIFKNDLVTLYSIQNLNSEMSAYHCPAFLSHSL